MSRCARALVRICCLVKQSAKFRKAGSFYLLRNRCSLYSVHLQQYTLLLEDCVLGIYECLQSMTNVR